MNIFSYVLAKLTGCATHTLDGTTVKCSTCSAGYTEVYTNNVAQGKCTKCTANCDVCTSSATAPCTTCKTGYIIDKDSKCSSQ